MSEDKKISVARFAGDVYDLDLRVYEALGSSWAGFSQPTGSGM